MNMNNFIIQKVIFLNAWSKAPVLPPLKASSQNCVLPLAKYVGWVSILGHIPFTGTVQLLVGLPVPPGAGAALPAASLGPRGQPLRGWGIGTQEGPKAATTAPRLKGKPLEFQQGIWPSEVSDILVPTT